LGNLSSTPASKRKKISKLLISSDDDSSSDESAKSSTKTLHSSEQTAVWKIDRLKASVQKPVSEPTDKHTTPETSVQKQPKEVHKKIVLDEERLKESKQKVRKEDTKHGRDKKSSTNEAASKAPEKQADDRSHKDASGKYSKQNESSGFKPLEKAKKTDAKQRQSYVIPKLKKTADNTTGSSSVLGDTWSDMLKRGAELEKKRPKQMPSSSASMRRIPKIVPKTSLCGKEDVGVLDKIEQHPGFLRWQQATSTKNTSKTEDERSSATPKSKADTSPRLQQTPTVLAKQTFSTVSSKPIQPLVHSTSESLRSPSVIGSQIPTLPLTSTKSLLPTPVTSQSTTLLSTPTSTRKKVLLPTPDLSRSALTSAAPIPVLVRRGASASSHSRFSSSPTADEDHFIPDETDRHPGEWCD